MTAETVLVCVTGQRMCERLIQRGAEVAQEHQLPLLVLSVVGNGQNSLGDPAVADALDYLYHTSASHGAEMTVLCSEKPLDTIVDFAHKHAVAHVVIGEGTSMATALRGIWRWRCRWRSSMLFLPPKEILQELFFL